MEISFSTIDKIKERERRILEIAWMSKDGIVNQRVCSSSNFFPPRDNPPGILENATTKDNERGSTAHFWMSFILITQNSGIRPKSDRLVFPAARSASAGCVTRGTTRNELIDSPSLLFYSSSSPRDTLYPAVFHAHAAAENSPPRVETESSPPPTPETDSRSSKVDATSVLQSLAKNGNGYGYKGGARSSL